MVRSLGTSDSAAHEDKDGVRGAVEGGRGKDQEGGGGTGPWKEGGKDQEGWRARTDRRSRGGDRRDSQQRISCPNRKSLVKSKAPWT